MAWSTPYVFPPASVLQAAHMNAINANISVLKTSISDDGTQFSGALVNATGILSGGIYSTYQMGGFDALSAVGTSGSDLGVGGCRTSQFHATKIYAWGGLVGIFDNTSIPTLGVGIDPVAHYAGSFRNGEVSASNSGLYISAGVGSSGKSLQVVDGVGSTTFLTVRGDGQLSYATSANFSWTAKTKNTVYQAASDGFVQVTITTDGSHNSDVSILSDASNPPTTARAVYAMGPGETKSFMSCVKQGDYYEVTVSNAAFTTAVNYWVPLGTAG